MMVDILMVLPDSKIKQETAVGAKSHILKNRLNISRAFIKALLTKKDT